MKPSLDSKPRLAPGCRLGENNSQRVLLMPERALRLNGPSLEIVSRCDGTHTVAQIVGELQKLYAKAEPARVDDGSVLDRVQHWGCDRSLVNSAAKRGRYSPRSWPGARRAAEAQ